MTLPGGIAGVKDFESVQAVDVNGSFTTTGVQKYDALATLTGNSTLKGTKLTQPCAAGGIGGTASRRSSSSGTLRTGSQHSARACRSTAVGACAL